MKDLLNNFESINKIVRKYWKLFKEVQEKVKELKKEFNNIKELSDHLLKDIKKDIEKYVKFSIAEDIDLFTLCKMAINYNIKDVDILGLEHVIDWFKKQRISNLMRGVYYLGKGPDGKHIVYLFYIDNNIPILDGEYPVGVFNTLQIDEDLEAFFKKNNLLILN